MTPDEYPILAAIRQGESKTLEYKAELPKGEQLAKTLIAFANGSGGKLVIGVDDQRQWIGLSSGGTTMETALC
jgi:ATP-dependent DNA helicase RecG